MRWTSERKDAVRRMWTKGSTSGQIAEFLGDVSRNAVMGMVDRLGLMGNRKTSGTRGTASATNPAGASGVTVSEEVPHDRGKAPVRRRDDRRGQGSGDAAAEDARHGADWRTVVGMVEEIMGEDYDPARPGHRSSLIAIASIVGGGDARSALPEGFPETAIARVLLAMDEGGIMTDGRAPARWLDAATGDVAFLIDMLVLDGVVGRPAADPHERN